MMAVQVPTMVDVGAVVGRGEMVVAGAAVVVVANVVGVVVETTAADVTQSFTWVVVGANVVTVPLIPLGLALILS